LHRFRQVLGRHGFRRIQVGDGARHFQNAPAERPIPRTASARFSLYGTGAPAARPVNSELPPRLLRKLCRLDDTGEREADRARLHRGHLDVQVDTVERDARVALHAVHLRALPAARTPVQITTATAA
jgi:hypothetical protein